MTPSPELIKQVAQELKEIQNAPPIVYGVTIPTCGFCGQIIKHGEKIHVETHKSDSGTHERFRGRCCGG